MKKTLGALVLTLSALVITAGCASTGGPSKPTPPQPDAGETWSKAGPSARTSRPVTAAAVPTSRLAK
jgi:hypothetical protein